MRFRYLLNGRLGPKRIGTEARPSSFPDSNRVCGAPTGRLTPAWNESTQTDGTPARVHGHKACGCYPGSFRAAGQALLWDYGSHRSVDRKLADSLSYVDDERSPAPGQPITARLSHAAPREGGFALGHRRCTPDFEVPLTAVSPGEGTLCLSGRLVLP